MLIDAQSRIVLLILALALGLGATACAGPAEQGGGRSESDRTPVRIIDGPVFESVQQVAEGASIYVRGIVGEVQSHELDGGGVEPETSDSSRPVKFVALNVLESSRPDLVPVGETTSVVWDDFKGISMGGPSSDLEPGDEVLIIALGKTRSEAPGIQSVDFFLAPVGGEAGVYDVRGDTAIARADSLRALKAADVPRSPMGPLKAAVKDVEEAARSSMNNG